MKAPLPLLLCALCACGSVPADPVDGDGTPAERTYRADETVEATADGVRVVMAYDAAAKAFVGTVENASAAPLRAVRVAVRWSAGQGLGPSAGVDLAPGEKQPVRLATGHIAFDWWRPEPRHGPAR